MPATGGRKGGNMKKENMGFYPIWFTGTRRTYSRTVYKKDDRFFVKWYGELIEVKRGESGNFYTVEEY